MFSVYIFVQTTNLNNIYLMHLCADFMHHAGHTLFGQLITDTLCTSVYSFSLLNRMQFPGNKERRLDTKNTQTELCL